MKRTRKPLGRKLHSAPLSYSAVPQRTCCTARQLSATPQSPETLQSGSWQHLLDGCGDNVSAERLTTRVHCMVSCYADLASSVGHCRMRHAVGLIRTHTIRLHVSIRGPPYEQESKSGLCNVYTMNVRSERRREN